jgi:CHAT domain-containing protein
MEPQPGMRFLGFGNPLYDRPGSAMKKGKISAASLMQEIYESLGFGLSPLEESQREIQKIARLFPEKKRHVYLKEEASEERVKTVPLADYQVIHFACHGFEDDRVPFRSGLFLASPQTPAEDGFLRADEIATLPLRSELVVLSACRTGTGFMERGEGTMGLTRIFLSAGARSVVSSLWQVSDSAAAEFMRFFYERLSRGASKAGALRLAKLGMLESELAHPFYWAAFILHGDPFSGLAFD